MKEFALEVLLVPTYIFLPLSSIAGIARLAVFSLKDMGSGEVIGT